MLFQQRFAAAARKAGRRRGELRAQVFPALQGQELPAGWPRERSVLLLRRPAGRPCNSGRRPQPMCYGLSRRGLRLLRRPQGDERLLDWIR